MPTLLSPRLLPFKKSVLMNRIEKCKKLQKSILGKRAMETKCNYYLEKLIRKKGNSLILQTV